MKKLIAVFVLILATLQIFAQNKEEKLFWEIRIMEGMNIRTDLALEAKNNLTEEDSIIKGIKVTSERDAKNNITIIKLEVLNKTGAASIGKPIGTYITMEVPNLCKEDDG